MSWIYPLAPPPKDDFNEEIREHKGVYTLAETKLALLCAHRNWKGPVWFPKSHIDDSSEVQRHGDKGTLVVTEWILEQKELYW
jgi:hypothetical protein